jgi:hypothetical protein
LNLPDLSALLSLNSLEFFAMRGELVAVRCLLLGGEVLDRNLLFACETNGALLVLL